jgi:hypothetical protein
MFLVDRTTSVAQTSLEELSQVFIMLQVPDDGLVHVTMECPDVEFIDW